MNHFSSSLPSVEYEVACYIMALPEVLKRIPNDSLKFPFEWVWVWDDTEEEKHYSDSFYYMDDPFKELVIAGCHMYNGESSKSWIGLLGRRTFSSISSSM